MKNKDDKEKLTYEILGDTFVGNLFDISNDMDNSSQNLVTYLGIENIKNLNSKYKNNNKKSKL